MVLCGVHHHLDPFPGNVEQPVGFDHLESLVHQRCRVDGNLLSHLPGGMPKGLLRRHAFDFLQRRRAEGAAGRGNQQPQNLVVLALKALPDGAGFAVYGQHLAAVPGFVFFDEPSGHHDGFLVGQSDRLSRLQCAQSRNQPHAPHKGHHHLVHLVQGNHFLHGREERARELAGDGGRAPDVGRAEFGRLLLEQLRVVAPGQPDYLELMGESPHDVQGLSAYGAGGAENYDFPHSPNPNASK